LGKPLPAHPSSVGLLEENNAFFVVCKSHFRYSAYSSSLGLSARSRSTPRALVLCGSRYIHVENQGLGDRESLLVLVLEETPASSAWGSW